MPNAIPAMPRIALQAGECRMPNAEAMTKSECRIGAISGWLHFVDSVRFSAFSAVRKAKALRAIRDIRVIRGSLLSVSFAISV
jgi:hypothetical protein